MRISSRSVSSAGSTAFGTRAGCYMRRLFASFLLLAASGCVDMARLSPAESTGPDPRLPAPRNWLFPTVHIAPARGWPAGMAPEPAPGMHVEAFATGLDH